MNKKFIIKTKKTFADREGKEVVSWNNVGSITLFQDATGIRPILNLSMFPDTQFYAFEDKPEDRQQSAQPTKTAPVTKVAYPTEDISPEDIPF